MYPQLSSLDISSQYSGSNYDEHVNSALKRKARLEKSLVEFHITLYSNSTELSIIAGLPTNAYRTMSLLLQKLIALLFLNCSKRVHVLIKKRIQRLHSMD